MGEQPEPIDPSEAHELFESDDEASAQATAENEVLVFHYYHVNHQEDDSLEVGSINSIHSQVITWFDVRTEDVKQVVVHHTKENMTHSFNVDLTDGTFPVEGCPCNREKEDAYLWVNEGRGLRQVTWGEVGEEPVTDDREAISHLMDG